MLGVGMRRRPLQVDRATRDELVQLTAQLRFAWPSLPAPILHEWSDDPVLLLDEGGPWLVSPAHRDPWRGSADGTVLPRGVRKRLGRIEKSGIPFQRMAIADELDPHEAAVRSFLPTLRSGPWRCPDENLARTLVGEVPQHPWSNRVIAMLQWAARGPRSTTNAPGPMASRRSRIIFGVIATNPPQDGQPCLWFPLAAWRW